MNPSDISNTVQILDNTLTPITTLKTLMPFDQSGNFLEYGDELSNWGECKFRVQTRDTMFDQFGNILEPFFYHVRIYRHQILVWSGVIVNNTKRTKNFIEVEARTYEYMLTKIQIRHDVSTAAGDGKDNYRSFTSGTMAENIQTILTEAIADAGSTNIVSRMKVGTIENPNFPANFTKSDGSALTGGWTFSTDFPLQFDYRDIFYFLSALANYSSCDFEITDDLTINFKQYIGRKQTDVMFEYSNYGSIDDFNIPLNGDRMANVLTGVAADYGNQILHTQVTDDKSVARYGKLQAVAAFIDVKNINALRVRLTEEARLVASPDTEVHVVLNDRAYPLGQYGLGDLVTIRIKHGVIDFNKSMRLVGFKATVDGSGNEQIKIITNPLKEGL